MPRSEVVKRMWVYFKQHNLLVKFIFSFYFKLIIYF